MKKATRVRRGVGRKARRSGQAAERRVRPRAKAPLSRKTSPRPRRESERRPRSRQAVRAAIARYGRASERVGIAAQEIWQAIDTVERFAVERYADVAVKKLLDRGIGHELLRLHRLLAERRALTTEEAFEFEQFPGLVLDWLRECLALEPTHAQSTEAEVPAASLSHFELDQEPGMDASGAPVVIEVLAAGWKLRGRTLRKPVARMKALSTGRSE